MRNVLEIRSLEPGTRNRELGTRGGCRGFTLVELLVVVAVIALLAAILVPTVSMAIRVAENARSSARLKVIGNAAEAYHMQTGYYPGQDNPNELWDGSVTKYTGSQLLARCLFYDPAKTEFPSPLYAAVGGGDIIAFNSATAGYSATVSFTPSGTALPIGSISDIFSRPLPLLYYPARLGWTAMIGTNPSSWSNCALQYDDNRPLVEMNDVYRAYNVYRVKVGLSTTNQGGYQLAMPTAFYRSKGVLDPRFTAPPNPLDPLDPLATVRRPDSFVLIGAGIDRCYFTPDDIVY